MPAGVTGNKKNSGFLASKIEFVSLFKLLALVGDPSLIVTGRKNREGAILLHQSVDPPGVIVVVMSDPNRFEGQLQGMEPLDHGLHYRRVDDHRSALIGVFQQEAIVISQHRESVDLEHD